MSFEIGKAFDGGAEWICSSTAVYGILSNPVFTALLITALALIIIYVTYRRDLQGTGWQRGVKTGFWLAVGISALVFVHYYALEQHLSKSNSQQGVRDVMASIHHSATAGGGYSVLLGGADAPSSSAVPADHRPANISAEPAAGQNNPQAGNLADLELQQVVLSSTIG